MSLHYYNQELNKILSDILNNNCFKEEDLLNLIEIVANTIYQYDQSISETKLKLIIHFLIEQKYHKVYTYNLHSEYNQNEFLQDQSKIKSKLEDEIDTDIMSPIDILDSDDDDIEIISINSINTIKDTSYINSESNLDDLSDKIQLSSSEDLITHRYDCLTDKYQESIYTRRRKRIIKLKAIPQFEQKSPEWLSQRIGCLTATAVAQALDEDPYRYPIELLFDKCGRGEPFVENANVHHGKKYEEIGNMFYSFRNNIKVAEYGLIQHEKYSFIGASPDGICEKYTNNEKLSKLVGRLLEIKFPKLRKIVTDGKLDGDICPHYYHRQVETQLFVTQLDECDFLQCQMEEYDSWQDFLQDSHPHIPGLSKKTNLEKGCLIQLLPKKMIGGDPLMCLYNAKYIYPPKLHMTHDEIEKWISTEMLNYHKNELHKNYLFDRVIYWRFTKIACHLIKANHQSFMSIIPQLQQFWDYILFYRKNTKKLDNLVSYVKDIGIKNSAIVFEKVHKDYLSLNPDTKYQPLYQEESYWRKKYNEKNAQYRKNYYQNHIKNKN